MNSLTVSEIIRDLSYRVGVSTGNTLIEVKANTAFFKMVEHEFQSMEKYGLLFKCTKDQYSTNPVFSGVEICYSAALNFTSPIEPLIITSKVKEYGYED